MSNSVDPDEAAHMSRLIWIYAVCKSLLYRLWQQKLFIYLLEMSWIHTYKKSIYICTIGLDVGIAFFNPFRMVPYSISILETIKIQQELLHRATVKESHCCSILPVTLKIY